MSTKPKAEVNSTASTSNTIDTQNNTSNSALNKTTKEDKPKTAEQQREELHSAIWKIADEVRGAVDGWDFKQFVLGTLFYRFISEDFLKTANDGNDGVQYQDISDAEILDNKDIVEALIQEKGFFIKPSQLFCNVIKTAEQNPNLNADIKKVFEDIEKSAKTVVGYSENAKSAEKDFEGLFADFDVTSTRLGNTVEEKNKRLAAILLGVNGLNFGDFKDNNIDLFGDAYEFLISNYAQNAGKSGGEFFTPQCVSQLIARLAIQGQEDITKVYDPACGSGSLLLQVKKQFDQQHQNSHTNCEFLGQEINHTTYNLARMNMFLHGINFNKFDIALGDTLLNPMHDDQKPFDVIVSNPPYSIKWEGDSNPVLINDDRFKDAGKLAPKSNADLAFVLHSLYHLNTTGRAAIVCFPGVFYRSGAEQTIREYLINQNVVETVIAMPSNLFYGTSIAVNILVLSKHKDNNLVQFIDASGEDFYKKATNNNMMNTEHIDKIMAIFNDKKDQDHLCAMVAPEDIAKNNFNLSVSTYVEAKDTTEKIDIKEVNKELEVLADSINRYREEIKEIISNID